MRLDLVILQIKAVCRYFSGNVAGSAAYAAGVADQVWLPTPAAYVVPLDYEATENQDAGAGIYQTLTERLNVIVQFDNSNDRRGQTVTYDYETVRRTLQRALLGWRPDSSIDDGPAVMPTDPGADASARGLMLVSGGLVTMDLSRLFYRFTFALEVAVTDDDGWIPPSVPLLDAEFTIPPAPTGDPPTFDTLGPYDIPLPQS